MVRDRQLKRSNIKIFVNSSGGRSGGMSGGKSAGNFSAMNNYTQEVVRALFSGLPMAIAGNAVLAGKMHFEMRVQPLYPLIEQAAVDNQGYADSFGVSLILDAVHEGVQVNVDALRLHQILANLLTSAIKFSPEGAKVLISVATDKQSVRVAIADQGPGITDSFRERISQKFSQADSSDTRSKSGTGLGLAITRELVERMHGSVGFDSMPGAGATFYFELPLVAGESRSIVC